MKCGKDIYELKVGDLAEFSKTITETDIQSFAEASGDFNPAHMDQAYAEKTHFKGRIAHGAMAVAFISNVLGNILPGPGTIYVSQEVRFLAPIRIGDTIRTKVEVVEMILEKNRVKFKTNCLNQEGKVVVEGMAWVLPPLAPEKG
jgi:3-hydroxybutyryl-CoA dehydratase